MQWDQTSEVGIAAGASYPAQVIEAEERTSAKGNPCLNLKLQVFVDANYEPTMYKTITPAYMPTLADFCRSAGLDDQLEKRVLTAADCRNKTCQVVMTAERNENGYYSIDTFETKKPSGKVEQVTGSVTSNAERVKRAEEDEIPF